MAGKKIKQVLMLSFSAPVFPSGLAFAQQRNDYGAWGMWPGMMWGFPMGWFGMVFMSIFWIAAILGLIFLIRWLIQSTRGAKDTGSALQGHSTFLKDAMPKAKSARKSWIE